MHGRADESLRVRGTLDAVRALHAASYVTTRDARAFDEHYRWLRTLEHRIQLVHLRRTHLMPVKEEARRVVARSMRGAADRGPATGEDMEGDLIVPGAVELHTDHLENHLHPRPKVRWNLDAAIQAHDAQVATAGITTVGTSPGTTIELAAKVVSASSSVSTSGSGTSAISASADGPSSASGHTMARVSESGQKARSRWYIPGWVIRSPRTRTPRSAARCLSASSSLRGP